jgi:hypothetical protein
MAGVGSGWSRQVRIGWSTTSASLHRPVVRPRAQGSKATKMTKMKKKPGQHRHHGNPQSRTSNPDPERSTPTEPHGQASRPLSQPAEANPPANEPPRPFPASLFSIYLFHWDRWRRPVNGHFTGQRKKSRCRSISPARQAQLRRSQHSPGPYDTGHIRHARQEPSQSVSGTRPVMAILIRVRMTARSRSQTRPGDREREKRKERT